MPIEAAIEKPIEAAMEGPPLVIVDEEDHEEWHAEEVLDSRIHR